MRDDNPSFMGPAMFFGLIIFVLAFEEAGPIYLNPQETMDLTEATGAMEQDRLAVSMPKLILTQSQPEDSQRAFQVLPAIGGARVQNAEAFTSIGWTQTPVGLSWRTTNFARVAEIGALPQAMPAVLHQGLEVAVNQEPVLTARAPATTEAEPQVAALPEPRFTVAGLFEAPEIVGAEALTLGEAAEVLSEPQANVDPAAPLVALEPEGMPDASGDQSQVEVVPSAPGLAEDAPRTQTAGTFSDWASPQFSGAEGSATLLLPQSDAGPEAVPRAADPDLVAEAPGLETQADPSAASGQPGQGWSAPALLARPDEPRLALIDGAVVLRPASAAVAALLDLAGPSEPTEGRPANQITAETIHIIASSPLPSTVAPQDARATYTPLIWRTVTGNYVNVRTGPSLDADVIRQIFVGYRVILIEPGEQFSFVNWPDPEDPFTGWVSNTYLIDQ